jgi:hypothetical protein
MASTSPKSAFSLFIIPIIIGVFSIVLYGQAATHPESYHWFIYIWGLAAYNCCFVGANIGAITYLLDSYPGSEGPILICIQGNHFVWNDV